MYPSYPPNLPSSINFAPIITVVGNDNKGDIVPPTNTNTTPDFNGLLINKDSINKENIELVSQPDVKEEAKNVPNLNDSAPQDIDFNNLVIKKSDS